MSSHSKLEKKYRDRGDDDLADAVLFLLGEEWRDGKLYSTFSMDSLDKPHHTEDEVIELCKNIKTLLLNEKMVSSDLWLDSSADSTQFFVDIKNLSQKYCQVKI
ncbi:hypothetical protein [Desulfogranum japonicum]|uniref:hypothetical protein n=1 Tax=Desulfogranum japonicum TaxID=231447 RepID=UPI0003F533F4|nr:hypothetical protein [Desulfogranum japonicum]